MRDCAPTIKMSLNALPGDHRIRAVCERMAEVMRVEVAPIAAGHAAPIHCSGVLRILPGATFGSGYASAMTTGRTRQLVKDAQDDLMLFTADGETIIQSPGHDDVILAPGDAALISQAREHRLVSPKPVHIRTLAVPHRDIARMLPRIGSAPLLTLQRNTPMLSLLDGYGRLLEGDPLAGAASQQLAARQLQEMLAVTLGQSSGFTAWTDDQSLSEVRLRTLRADISAHLKSRPLRLDWLAARQGVTARTLQRLLSERGTSFQEELRKARLHAARTMLQDPRNARMSVTAVAYECGFSETSVLTRAFKLAFGMTPGEAKWKHE